MNTISEESVVDQLLAKLQGRNEKETVQTMRLDVPVVCAAPERGLTADQVRERMEGGWANLPVEPAAKTTKQIILSNTFTYFNILFFFLALCVIAVCFIDFKQIWQLGFMGVIIVNTVIGIVQELRSKKTLEKLNVLAAPQGLVIRDGEEKTVATDLLVRDDIVVFSGGNQIYADAVVVAGDCSVNEALITGEADEIKKHPGDKLLSGSFLVNGECRARLTDVGADSYVSKLTLEAKRAKPPRKSEMMRSLEDLVKWIGLLVIPLGIIMFIKEHNWLGFDLPISVTSTVASIIGMIPEGLYLLTSLALVAGVVRLAQRKTLVHELECIETLARVDTLCVDKTGTVTENKMTVDDVHLLDESRFSIDDVRTIMGDYVYAMKADNDTMAALRRYFTGEVTREAIETLPFSSAKKYGGVSFHAEETYLLGAPDVLLAAQDGLNYDELINGYSAKGCRVLLLGMYDGALTDDAPTAQLTPIALILLSNKIRAEAPDTFGYFAKQGVQVKVISGDNALAVSEVAKRAGIEGAADFVDARTLKTPEDIAEAAEKYNVFGRVTPAQKRQLVQALKKQGHTVAMTGDGVNDVLALKEADCSIAVASGSEVAAQVSNIVLMDNNFASMPSVVAEGRRVINNIERSASLYLVKNIFTFFLAIFTLLVVMPYPLSPNQLTLVNSLTIGIPSFILAMEPNESLVRGRFLRNVILRALPAALTDVALIVGVLGFYIAFDLDRSMLSTICTGVMGIVGLMMVHQTCKPYNLLRKVMMISLTVAYLAAYLVCTHYELDIAQLVRLDLRSIMILVVLGLLAWPIFTVLTQTCNRLRERWQIYSEVRQKHKKMKKEKAE